MVRATITKIYTRAFVTGCRLLTILENDTVMVNRKTGASNQIVWRLCVLKGNLASDWIISFVEKTIVD